MSLEWTIRFSPRSLKQLKKLDSRVSERIVATLERSIADGNDPRRLAEPLVGEWIGYWRFRIGDYRAICQVKHLTLMVYVVEVGHRREVYR